MNEGLKLFLICLAAAPFLLVFTIGAVVSWALIGECWDTHQWKKRQRARDQAKADESKQSRVGAP